MATFKGSTELLVKIATILSKVHVAFTLEAGDEGKAVITTANQATLDAAVEAAKR